MTTVRNEKWHKDVLAFDPYEGDREDARLLRDKIVVARKPGSCLICAEPISAGDLVRSIAEVCEDAMVTNRFCTACCDAMAKSREDDTDLIARYGIGWKKAQAEQP